MASADCVAKVLSRSMTCGENSPGVFLLTRARRGPARRRGARAGKLEPGYHHRDHRAVAGLASPGRLRDGALGRLWRAHVILDPLLLPGRPGRLASRQASEMA